MTRRDLLGLSLAAPAAPAILCAAAAKRRIVVLMLDGFGLEYYDHIGLPTMNLWAAGGVFARVKGQMPAVTNTNNASICCGVPASVHGITGNSYFNRATGMEDFMESGTLLRAPTLFQKAAAQNLKSALFTCKKKTATLLNAGAAQVIAAETPSPEVVKRYGEAPPIYSADINHWLMEVVIDHLRTRKEFDILYVHTTDYPMHMHAPDAPESIAHLGKLDAQFAAAARVAPDAAFYLTADHGMNRKTRAWDLGKACAARQAPVKLAISAERDKYPKHHLGLGGIAWVYLNQPADAGTVRAVIEKLPGVEKILTRPQAAKQFELMPDRIGDLVVTGDKETVFGTLDSETETLDRTYRSHGSEYETNVPLIIHNEDRKRDPKAYRQNRDLTAGILAQT